MPEHDDIDISIKSSEIKKVEQIIPEIIEIGYRLRSCYYKNILFQLKFLPIINNKLMTIDIKIYYDSKKDFYWSIKKRIKIQKNSIIKKINYRVLKKWYWPSDEAHIDKIPLSLVFTPLTWILPIEYIDSRVFYNNNFYIPCHIEKYLKFHFGDWRIANNNWRSYRHDRAIIHKSPERFLNTSSLLKYIK
ncbi:MAG: hypothetical protein HN601_02505 [Candidatus Marinimicrobia bacterium]|nr:hypothetical protein [Candidatus Neomarinimicrobiota bacterium]